MFPGHKAGSDHSQATAFGVNDENAILKKNIASKHQLGTLPVPTGSLINALGPDGFECPAGMSFECDCSRAGTLMQF